MLLGTEIGAALTALEPLGIDLIGLNCATGPAEMSEHLRTWPGTSAIGLSCMPNAGLPVLTSDGAHYPLTPERAGRRPRRVHPRLRPRAWSAAAAAPRPSTSGRSSTACAAASSRRAGPAPRPRRASLYQHVPFRQDTAYLSIGERTNANGSKAFREAMLDERWDDCVEIARDQIRDGAHLLDLCIDYVGRDGVADMRELAGRLATASTLPIVLDSTEPAVLEAGLEMLGGRAVDQLGQLRGRRRPGLALRAGSCRWSSSTAPRVVALTIDEEGQARTADWKVRVADRLIRRPDRHAGACASSDILVDSPDLPDRHRPGGDPPRRHRDARGDPRAQDAATPTCRPRSGVSNVSFGLNPAARQVLNSVFLHECVAAGLDSAIVHAVEDPADVARSRTSSARSPSTWSTTVARRRRRQRRLRPAAAVPRAVRGRGGARRCTASQGRGARGAAAVRAARAPHHRRRAAAASRPTSTRRCQTGRRWRSSTTPARRA